MCVGKEEKVVSSPFSHLLVVLFAVGFCEKFVSCLDVEGGGVFGMVTLLAGERGAP